jgi:hypothetical protein
VGFDIDPLDLPVLLDGVVLEGTRRIHRRIVDDDVETAGLFCETGKLARQRVGVREIETALDEAGGLRSGTALRSSLHLIGSLSIATTRAPASSMCKLVAMPNPPAAPV